MRPSLDERRAVRKVAADLVGEAWDRLDAARRGRAQNARSWLWRRFWGRAWARHVVARRVAVRASLAQYLERKVAADREHAWMVLNQQADRLLANWIRSKHGKDPYTLPRPPPTEVEVAWAAHLTPEKGPDGKRLRGPDGGLIFAPRPVTIDEARTLAAELLVDAGRAPGAPSPAALVLDGEVRGVEVDEHGRCVALHRTPDGRLLRSLITDAQARALAERIAAAEAADDG